MNEGKRPGGLTALAVINFVLTGFNLLGVLGWTIILLMVVGIIPTDEMNTVQKTQMEAFEKLGISVFIFIFVLSIVSSVLLLVSGIGYLKQKKFMGRMIGNIYAIVAILSSVLSGFVFASRMADLGGGFNLGTIIGLIYPLATLILLNTTFKDDLTN
ncbi:MAG: hypothetical protein ACYS0H_08340 [Planctomycetota bacterium]|jgi:hypothetical protein